jgi:starch synthase
MTVDRRVGNGAEDAVAVGKSADVPLPTADDAIRAFAHPTHAAAKVLAVVSEIYPLVKTGGLADVAAALPRALRQHGVEVTTLVPGYPAVTAAFPHATEVFTISDLFGGGGRVLAGQAAGLDLLVLDAPHLFARGGNPYSTADGADWPDNALRFGALGLVAARIGLGDVAAYVPDIIHGHDWQAGLTMAYLAYDGWARPATVMTVHNLAFQGQFPPDLLDPLRLPPHAYAPDGVEYYGGIGFLKAGLQFADRITTVSPTYAAEIQTQSGGFGLDGLLRARSAVLSGIINGIDVEVWNPRTDIRIPAQYDRSSLHARAANKAELQKRFGLREGDDRLLLAAVSRLAWQKGLDLLADAVPVLLDTGAQLVILGTGDAGLERRLSSIASARRGRIGCLIGYDEDLAHLIQAGADAVVVPSRYEPCGLTQLCALRYGALPVVSRVGGLADTIIDLGPTAQGVEVATGLHFSPVTREALETALRRTAELWSDQETWRRLQANGMRTDVSWTGPAARYASLYAGLLAAKI